MAKQKRQAKTTSDDIRREVRRMLKTHARIQDDLTNGACMSASLRKVLERSLEAIEKDVRALTAKLPSVR